MSKANETQHHKYIQRNVKRPVGLASGLGVPNALCGQPEVQPLAVTLVLMRMLVEWIQLGCPDVLASVGPVRWSEVCQWTQ